MQDFATRLLGWFDQNGRKDLPWQQNKTPYRVWVSEIMLQQTQVTTVIPYFLKFMETFPTLDKLASASQDDVLHQWTGLGYYARARNLHKSAQTIMRDYNGEMPRTQEELESLPGIGRSTAAAIIAICTDQRATILDGNVKRVLARIFAIEGWPGKTETRKRLWLRAEELTPVERVADYTQAIMDLGATLCRRSSPECERCPFMNDCQARHRDAIDQFPGRKPGKKQPVRQASLLVIDCDGDVLLQKQPDEGLWGGLWSFPDEPDCLNSFLKARGLKVTGSRPLPRLRHTFSHFHLDIAPTLVSAKPESVSEPHTDETWYNLHEPARIGLTGIVNKILATR